MKFACLLALAAFASAETVTADTFPAPDLAKAKTGYNQLPAGAGKNGKATSASIQSVAVDGNGGFTSIIQTVTPAGLPDGAVVQSWVGLIGVGDYNDNMYSIGTGRATDPDSLSQVVACGTPRSMTLPGYQTAASSELSVYYCSLKVSNVMKQVAGSYVHTTSLALYDKKVTGALLRNTTVPTVIGFNIYKDDGTYAKVIDSWTSDQFSLIMDGAVSIAATVSVAAAIAVMEF